ncbi:PREDICTED: caspase-1-like isoform X2 [Habropoda laboriosa]|uniref:caspase-1-like isoform X2 n=1 Tax=Habropoda laboriosa TaxID=597456 RepID=UPI00083E25A0|nr:PREDICTED: caspase-1-like isoform X2 [Habropoda laboriosa]
MFVILFHFFTITRLAIVYISSNLIGKMNRRSGRQLVNNDRNPHEKTNQDKRVQSHVPENEAMKINETVEKKPRQEEDTTDNSEDSLRMRGQSHVPKDEAMKINETVEKKPCEEEDTTDNSKDAPKLVPDSPHYSEKSGPSRQNLPIQVYHCGPRVARPRTRPQSRRGVADNMVDTFALNDAYATNANEYGNSSEQFIIECPTPRDSPVYNMNLQKRGKCVIFNQKLFEEGNGEPRIGTEHDVNAISSTFGALGFEIEVHTDLYWYEVNDEIDKLSQDNHKDCDCICIFILTHGERGGRLYAKDASYPFLAIWRPFTADNCPSLFGKPKLFFIQACKGGRYDNPVQGRSAIDHSGDSDYAIPSQADFLFGYSAMEDFYAVRDEGKGSWYIQALCDVIKEHWQSHDLVRMLTITSRKVAIEKETVESKYWSSGMKQMPNMSSTLTRDIYFTPKAK